MAGRCEPQDGLLLGIRDVLHHVSHPPVAEPCSSLSQSKYAITMANSNWYSHSVMESFDMFLNGNFVALSHFQERYGVQVSDPGVEPIVYAIETKWQSSLFQAGQCGAFVGVFMAGPITNILGYRLTTLLGLVLMNATIFISFFVGSLLAMLRSPMLTKFR
jgi:MFS family permease